MADKCFSSAEINKSRLEAVVLLFACPLIRVELRLFVAYGTMELPPYTTGMLCANYYIQKFDMYSVLLFVFVFDPTPFVVLVVG